MYARAAVTLSLLTCSLAGCTGGTTGTDTSATDTADTGDAAWLESLRLDASDGALRSVWAADTGVAWAVGGNPDAGLIYRYSGDTWIEELLGAPVPLLTGVDGSGGEVWAVGESGVALRRIEDGWTRLDTPTDEPLWDVWSAPSGVAWAVGGDPQSDNPVVIMRFDGVDWQAVGTPALDRPCSALFRVWGAQDELVFAVGESGVLLRYDGTVWTQEDSGTTEDLRGVWGAAADDIVAVGGDSSATLVRYDGAAWTATKVDGEPALTGVWMDLDRAAHVSGLGGRVGVVEPGAMSFAGETVSDLDLLGVTGIFGGSIIAVGGDSAGAPPWQGVALVGAR